MDVTTLNRNRGGIKAQITRMSRLSDEEIESKNKLDIENKIETLKKLECKLDDLKVDYYKVLKNEEVSECEQVFEEIDDELQQQKVRLKQILESKKVIIVEQANVEESIQTNFEGNKKLNIKLPEITLPKFDGNYENWNNFITQFNSIIACNEMLSDSHKLFYLQSSLVGNAKQIQSFEDTFDSLMNALKNRYENKRLIVNSHMNSLLGIENIAFESAERLRMLVDCVLKHVRALKVMKIEMDEFSENLLINIVLKKLDRVTRKEFEMTLTSSELPEWNKFISFLEERCQILENLQKCNYYNMKPKPQQVQNKAKNFVLNSKGAVCNLCKKSLHALYNCELFLKMNPIQRFDFVKKQRLCLLCLSQSHQLINCKCKYACKFCKSKAHNYLLHRNETNISEPNIASEAMATLERMPNADSQVITDNSEPVGSSQTLSSCFATKKKNVVLATAVVYIKNKNGALIKGRAILDSGSQVSAVSTDFANCLGLKQKRINMSVSSLAGKSLSVKKETTALISNFDGTFSASLQLLILPKVTDLMPATCIELSQFHIPQNLILADPNFYKPSKVDMLIGAELFFDILKAGTIHITNSLMMKETVFGYIICGTIKCSQETKHCGFISQLDELEENVKQFWELENMEDSPSLTDEENECEKIFSETYRRDKITGKYTVNLPIKKNLDLGDSKGLAKIRLEHLWKRLNRNSEMKKLYTDFMMEYENLGHMEEIEFSNNLKFYIMPHHGVFRDDSTTTRLRVVFDASAPSSNGISLNNCLLKGGVVQEDLFSILLRFRKHKIAFVADVQKMYRQIWVNPEQRNLQCILWKNDSNQEAKLYQLKTVTYGTACAPFLATRALKQLALDEKDHYPLASVAALSDFYVDDILTGAGDITTALELQEQLIKMLNSGGMTLHKWCSNEKQLLDRVSFKDKEYDFTETNKSTVKTLGLRWDPREENFQFNVSSSSDTPTKRSVLSEIARLFDPLGLLGPVITQAKKFMQKLWQMKIEWNEELPHEEKERWEAFRRNLLQLRQIKIPRYVLIDCIISVEIHGFSDAAKEAYGAVVYLRCTNSKGEKKVSLLCSKSRIAPIKEMTMPRLELCGAVLLARLVKKVIPALKTEVGQVFLYTDSQIVLAWIAKPLSELKLFVKNRVSVIQELTDLKCWKYVCSKENPADVLSRGVDANKIEGCKVWWGGPPFLHKEIETVSCTTDRLESSDLYLQELKEVHDKLSAFLQGQETLAIINNSSSFVKLQRVIAWCLRFIKNAKLPKVVGCLSSDELSHALRCIVINVQATAFHEEIQCLKKGKPLPCSSNLLNLCPFLDSQGILRVGGRLKNSSVGLNQKHPMLIPNNHNFAFLIINHYHLSYFHVGAEGTLSFIRTKFWIVRARNIVRKLVNQCVVCRRVSAKGSQQVMADLPAARISPSRVFNKVGVDFAGPFTIKTFAGRNKNLNKCFVCIFICFTVKAVHFEIVHGLTSEAFLCALKRFIARRGKPSEIFSDNGTNFVGANNELRKIIKDLFHGSKELIEDYIASEGVKWNFNPPSAPHFGGLWEAGIKSLKYHLKRVIGNTVLSHEEFLTLVTQIEAVLNSRPLCPLSSDPNDISALTPAHFLVGSSLVALPDPDYSEIPMNRLNRWQLIQKFSKQIWKRWSNEYLNRLQQRPKWPKGHVNFKEGDIVLVKSDNPGYLKWNLARILKVHQGKDNRTRVVTIQTKTGTLQRPVTKISALPFVN